MDQNKLKGLIKKNTRSVGGQGGFLKTSPLSDPDHII